MEGSRYRTSDLYYAAYLKVAGITYLGVEWVEDPQKKKPKGFFLFEDAGPVTMRELKDQYFRDTARVPALSFGQAIRDLKSELFKHR